MKFAHEEEEGEGDWAKSFPFHKLKTYLVSVSGYKLQLLEIHYNNSYLNLCSSYGYLKLAQIRLDLRFRFF